MPQRADRGGDFQLEGAGVELAELPTRARSMSDSTQHQIGFGELEDAPEGVHGFLRDSPLAAPG